MKNNILGNMELAESLLKKYEEPLLFAAKQLESSGIAQYSNLTTAMPNQLFETVGSAYLDGAYLFEDSLAQQLYDIYNPPENVLGDIAITEQILGADFQELVQPSLYLANRSGVYDAVEGIASMLSSTSLAVDTSWMQQVNPWLAKVSDFYTLDTSTLLEVDTGFSKLIKLEQETSRLTLMEDHFFEITSAAAQLASIEKSISDITEPWREVIAPGQFLDDYSSFASRQHVLIQKAASAHDDKAVEWRLNLLDATSRFVDRQITWAGDFAADIQEDINAEELPVLGSELDIDKIPQYIGYSKRDDKGVDEAFAKSVITVITEKGKLIVDKALLIQKFCKVNKNYQLFEDTDLYVGSYVTLAGTFCSNTDLFETVVDALYRLFYSQKESFSRFVDIDGFECMERIRDLKDKRNYPERPREISNLQDRLYDQFLKLEEIIIEKLASDNSTVLSEGCWEEEAISNNIFRALLNLQKNKIFNGKKEDELNDGVRDNLSMIYEMKDQTRQGTSVNGKGAGEVDLQICRDGLPIAMIEGLKVSSVERKKLQGHIDKVLTSYDPVGCPYVYVIIYSTAKNFSEFWEKCLDYIRKEYNFPYTVKEKIQETNHMHTESRHAKVVLCRDSKEVSVHFYALLVQ